jgi:hypothetical protein
MMAKRSDHKGIKQELLLRVELNIGLFLLSFLFFLFSSNLLLKQLNYYCNCNLGIVVNTELHNPLSQRMQHSIILKMLEIHFQIFLLQRKELKIFQCLLHVLHLLKLLEGVIMQYGIKAKVLNSNLNSSVYFPF